MSIHRLGKVRSGFGPTGEGGRVMVIQDPLGRQLESLQGPQGPQRAKAQVAPTRQAVRGMVKNF